MSDNKMSDELQIAIRRSPEYTAPSAELVALRAEVAGWRRAVRWDGGGYSYALRVRGPEQIGIELAVVWNYGKGWHWQCAGVTFVDAESRNAACAKVCKLLGIPVVLPGGGGE